jgi:ribonuclease-3
LITASSWDYPEGGGSSDKDEAIPFDARSSLERDIGYSFRNAALLETAMSHRSWSNMFDGAPSYERLEYLGDAVLSLVVADYTYKKWSDLQEGPLAKIRSDVVSQLALAEIATKIGLGDLIKLGKGEIAEGGRSKPSILSDVLEALIGAIYIDNDSDLQAVYEIIIGWLEEPIEQASKSPGMYNYKESLQMIVQKDSGELPEYIVDGKGPDHSRRFNARVYINGELKGSGSGSSKKNAEQMAAKSALQNI